MNEIQKILSDVVFPRFFKAHCHFCEDHIKDIPAEVKKALQRQGTLGRIERGQRVVLTGSSRDIAGADVILKSLCEEIRGVGATPYIVPGMGSHGGACAEGQLKILQEFGITEQAMGAQIVSSMDTVEVGKTADGFAVHVDKFACGADHIIPVNRIKPHPEFHGRHESGVMKMLAIGLGKQHGADQCHNLGMAMMPENIRKFGQVILEKCSIPFGVGIIENPFHKTYGIYAMPGECIEAEEPALLKIAKEILPVIPFEKVDVLICEEMGKDISGTGMDSNVIGRSISMGISRPFIERVGVFRLTDKSNGNFNGVGLADCISKNLFDAISFLGTYPNSLTASELNAVKIPVVMETDELCVRTCIRTCIQNDAQKGIRLVWIKNTLSLQEMWISEALFEEASQSSVMSVYSQPHRLAFLKDGSYAGFEVSETKQG